MGGEWHKVRPLKTSGAFSVFQDNRPRLFQSPFRYAVLHGRHRGIPLDLIPVFGELVCQIVFFDPHALLLSA